jgi:tricorn protease
VRTGIANYDAEQAGMRIDRIYRGDTERPHTLSPLERAGVEEGDVLLSVNGISIDSAVASQRLGQLLLGTSNQQVRLELLGAGSAAAGAAAAAAAASDGVVLRPISSAQAADLRYLDWEMAAQRRTEQLGEGQIGYIHLRAMGGDNYAEFASQFFPVFNRAGLVLDVRHNRGGNIDSWILEKLLRQAWFFWAPRGGEPYGSMQYHSVA